MQTQHQMDRAHREYELKKLSVTPPGQLDLQHEYKSALGLDMDDVVPADVTVQQMIRRILEAEFGEE